MPSAEIMYVGLTATSMVSSRTCRSERDRDVVDWTRNQSDRVSRAMPHESAQSTRDALLQTGVANAHAKANSALNLGGSNLEAMANQPTHSPAMSNDAMKACMASSMVAS